MTMQDVHEYSIVGNAGAGLLLAMGRAQQLDFCFLFFLGMFCLLMWKVQLSACTTLSNPPREPLDLSTPCANPSTPPTPRLHAPPWPARPLVDQGTMQFTACSTISRLKLSKSVLE